MSFHTKLTVTWCLKIPDPDRASARSNTVASTSRSAQCFICTYNTVFQNAKHTAQHPPVTPSGIAAGFGNRFRISSNYSFVNCMPISCRVHQIRILQLMAMLIRLSVMVSASRQRGRFASARTCFAQSNVVCRWVIATVRQSPDSDSPNIPTVHAPRRR